MGSIFLLALAALTLSSCAPVVCTFFPRIDGLCPGTGAYDPCLHGKPVGKDGKPCPRPTPKAAVNPEPPAVPLPIRACDRDVTCHCWGCADTEAQRRAVGAPSAVCQQRYYIPCVAK